MYGSILTESVVYQRLSTDDTIVQTVSDSLYSLRRVPQTGVLPAMLFYMESSQYTDFSVNAVADDLNMETIRFVVKAVCEGTSVTPIEEVAHRQLELLAGLAASVVYRERNYELLFSAAGEIPLTMVEDRDAIYRQLGTEYSVEITRGE